MPWTDHAGRFSLLKAVVLAFTLYPAAWLVLRWGMADLGPRPLTETIHRSGDWAVRFLVFALAVTPARALLDWSRVMLVRRMLGVAAALYAGLHLVLYVADQKWNLWTVVTEIVLRFYLTVGFVTVVGLAVLAWTSTDGWQKRLRQRWKALHRWAYPLTGLALFHYALQAKINASDAVFWFGLFIWLMLWRALPRARQVQLGMLAALAPAAALVTAATEVAWYGLATKVPAGRVLQANLGFDPWGRPASQVLLLGLAVVALVALRRVRRARPAVT
jgi:methionine sulfoxide reductase heme-binding subunit